MPHKIRILCLDGGGIRGLIPAVILSYVEECIQKKTGNKNAVLADYFDMIGGTSTGGILTCLYLVPPKEGNSNKSTRYFAHEAITMYKEHAENIFKTNLPRALASVRMVYDEKYLVDDFEKLLNKYFGDTKLSELIRPALITSYDIEERRAIFFTQPEAKESPFQDYYLKDIARATSAAPTYFEVADIKSMGGHKGYFIDGGLVANNPALCTIVEAMKTPFANMPCPLDAKDMYVVSISTGKELEPIRFDKAKDFGAARWIGPVISILMSSSSETVDYHLQKIFRTAGCSENYLRIDPPLCRAGNSMDNVSRSNLDELENAGKDYIAKHLEQLDNLANKLIEYA